MRGPAVAFDDSTRHAVGGSHRDRDTWIQDVVAAKTWVPGPGTHKTEREFVLESKDEIDPHNTVQERCPRWIFQREAREVGQEVKDVKVRRNSFLYPKPSSFFTPG